MPPRLSTSSPSSDRRCRSPPRSVRPCWPSCKSSPRTSLCGPDARSHGSTMPATKAGSSANSILGLRTTGPCLSCRSRISPSIAGCPWRGRSRPTRNTASSACVAAARRRRLGRITEGRWPSERDPSVWFGEHRAEEFFGAAQALLGEHDGLGLVDRVANQALLVEPVQRIPIKPLPGPPVVVKGQKEERQHRFVNLVRVERHPPTLPVSFELRWGSWPHAYFHSLVLLC